MCCTGYSCQILMKLDLFRQTFEKLSDFKFIKTPSSGSRVFACEKMDGLSDFSQFCVRT